MEHVYRAVLILHLSFCAGSSASSNVSELRHELAQLHTRVAQSEHVISSLLAVIHESAMFREERLQQLIDALPMQRQAMS